MRNLVIEGQSLEWLLESAADAMLIIDADGKIMLANPALDTLFGYASGQLIGQLLEVLIPMRFRHAHGEQRNGFFSHPKPRSMGSGADLFGQHADGREFPVEVSLSPLQTGQGLPLVLATIHDISQRKQAELKQRQLLEEVRTANEELSNFAYVVSHDLKAPLRGIGSLADWVATDYGHLFDDKGREHMRLMIKRVHRMGGLIDGILQYSRVGRVKEARVPLDLNLLLADVIDLLAPPATITVAIDGPLPTVTGEPIRIQQLFQNLISNAIKYMDKPQGQVRIGCRDDGTSWRFHVSDNGPGIEQRHFDRIFQLFQTLAPRDKVESTGVGLALVKKIVEMYHGRVWVESVVGEGASFFCHDDPARFSRNSGVQSGRQYGARRGRAGLSGRPGDRAALPDLPRYQYAGDERHRVPAGGQERRTAAPAADHCIDHFGRGTGQGAQLPPRRGRLYGQAGRLPQLCRHDAVDRPLLDHQRNAMMPAHAAAGVVPIRVLLVEDDTVDRMACQRAFDADPVRCFELLEADSGQQGLLLAQQERPDCILLDYQLPDLTGLEFLERLNRGAAKAVPVMMLTGADNATVAAESIRRGALDYIVKDSERRYLALLPAAIERMLREQRLINEKRQIEAKFRTLVEQIQAITYTASAGANAALRYISPQIRLLGFTPAEWLARPELHLQQLHADDREEAMRAIAASRLHGSALRLEYRMHARDGSILWLRDEAEAVLDAGPEPVIQGILVDITSHKLAEASLRQTRDALRELAAHQETIREDERKRIAREVHDELGGLLSGIRAYISVSVERASSAGAVPDPLLVDAAALAKDAMDAVRRVITDLRPSVLDQLGIWAALEWYTDQIAQRSGISCLCEIDAALAACELDAERSTMLFRIVQEALTNVVRHAQASQVSVRAVCGDGQLALTVQDNGVGIDTSKLAGGASWGVLGMMERARHFGGELQVSGVHGAGTTLRLLLPWEDADAS